MFNDAVCWTLFCARADVRYNGLRKNPASILGSARWACTDPETVATYSNPADAMAELARHECGCVSVYTNAGVKWARMVDWYVAPTSLEFDDFAGDDYAKLPVTVDAVTCDGVAVFDDMPFASYWSAVQAVDGMPKSNDDGDEILYKIFVGGIEVDY